MCTCSYVISVGVASTGGIRSVQSKLISMVYSMIIMRKKKKKELWHCQAMIILPNDTLRLMESGVLIFQRLFSTLLYVAGTIGSVLINKEVSLLRRSLIERFHCTAHE